MKILLAHRCQEGGLDDPWAGTVPHGLLTSAAALRKAGHECLVANFSRLGWKEVEQFLRGESPDVVGVTCFTPNRRAAIRLTRLARRAHPGAVTLLGGPHAVALAPLLLERVRELDACLVGPGEVVLPALAEALARDGATAFRRVAGLWTRRTLRRPEPVALDPSAVPPALLQLDGAGLEAERDLAWLCLSVRAPGGAAAFRTTEALLRDARVLRRDHGVVELSFLGPGLFGDPAFLRHLSTRMVETKTPLAWDAVATLDELAPEPVEAAAERALVRALRSAHAAGCRRVRLSVDAADGHPSVDRLARASGVLRRTGLAAHLTVLFGAEGDAAEEADRLRRAVRAVRPQEGRAEPRAVWPGSGDWERLAEPREWGPAFWFEDEQEFVRPVGPRHLDLVGPAVEHALREAAREARPAPRDLEALEAESGATAWVRIAWGDFRAAAGDLEEAESHYRAAARLEPWSPFPWLALARAAGRGARAVPSLEREALQEVLSRVPRHARSRERLGELRRRRGRRGGRQGA